MKTASMLVARATAAGLLLLTLAGFDTGPTGQVLDEARSAGRDAASFPAATEDFFHDMDGGIALTPEEVKGRNMWNVWSGGDDRFWDTMTASTFGAFDLLKIVAYNPAKPIDRDRRWTYLGLINEPCFDAPAQPDPAKPDTDHFGLLLDKRRTDCPADPFADESKYPGVKIGARGTTVPVGSFYGYPSGIVGLRLFPNPAFDEAAAKHWDAKRYFSDPSYYNDKDLVRPVPRRHVVRLLSYRAEPDQSAGQPGASGLEKSEFDGRGAVHVGRSAVRV